MSLQPSFGRVYVYFESKSTYLASLFVFEVGSIICATAPSSQVLIFGRAVAGAGSAGMLTGSLAIYGQVVPLRQRPAGMALITAMYALAGLLGPTLGGVFTDAHQLTWRFCFWINLRESSPRKDSARKF
jgi:MFS family permease